MPLGKLGDLLLEKGLVTPEQLKIASQHQDKTQSRLSSALIQLGHVNEKVLATFFSKVYGFTAISLEGVQVTQEAMALVPVSLCEKYGLVPLMVENNHLLLAISDPSQPLALDEVKRAAQKELDVYIATESAIRALVQRVYPAAARPPVKPPVIKSEEKTSLVEVNIEDNNVISAGEEANKPVIRFLNKIFTEALRRKSSDVHFEPLENYTRVRFRIDGSLHEFMNVPAELRASVPARIKVMANLDISEKRLPQDGRFQISTRAKKIDVRVSTLPTMFGEKVVLRLLDQGGFKPDLKLMGFEEDQLELFRWAARQPFGMVLVTGPTGSGKSTSIYAALSELNQPDVNISTVEDPVEYHMAGINQVQTKEEIGLTFAATLRSLLRQDPDIIFVGEIRDQETAEIAIKASLTGHLVFSTLHTNDATSAVTRLMHMGIEPFLITASLSLVEAQRLVRIICSHCKEPDTQITAEMMLNAEVPEAQIDQITPYRGRGCERCANTGYRGRMGIFEVMQMSEAIREIVVKGGNADKVRKAAIQQGMRTLRQSALLKFYRGETSLEEVLFNSKSDKELKS